ncbi:MAG: winged helix-turn-helix transcriptional regulator [Bryobacterales bacterium]|nr:winged helix-turn-helix transcriptional regulator [Bryobacterales bacterium]
MPARVTVSRELSSLFAVLANPHRVRLVEELREGEVDVNGLQKALGISHSSVSQHLAVLRAHRIVAERREGRHVFYRLTQAKLAEWVRGGLDFIERDLTQEHEMRAAVEQARVIWSPTGGTVPVRMEPTDD